MKTITEFPSMNLKNAAKVKQDLITSGKTPEELSASLGEALKLEGSRLEFMVAALEIVGTKLNDLKRVIVYTPLEGEKAPQGLQQKGEHFYSVEYFPSLNKPAKPSHPVDDRRNEGRGDRKKQGGRGGNTKNAARGPEIPRPPKPEGQVIINAAVTPSGQEKPRPAHPHGPRTPRAPRAPRPPRAVPVVHTGPPIIIKPLTPITAVASSAPVEAPVETPVEVSAESKDI